MIFGKAWSLGALAITAPLALATAAAAADQPPIKIAVIAEAVGDHRPVDPPGRAARRRRHQRQRRRQRPPARDWSSTTITPRRRTPCALSSARHRRTMFSAVVSTFISEVYSGPRALVGAAAHADDDAGRGLQPDQQAGARRLRRSSNTCSRAGCPRRSSPPRSAIASHDIFADRLHMKTAAIMSEDADWTSPLDAAQAEVPAARPG